MCRRGTNTPTVGAVAACAMAMLAVAGTARADDPDHGFSFYGDVRGRVEYDWDSARGDGTERDDRGRVRIRARLGFEYTRDGLEVGARLRTGSEASQQSPHITVYDFDGNSTGDADVDFDKWYVRYRTRRTRTFAGRDGIPWWFQDELIWDGDITPAGVGFVFEETLGEDAELTMSAGWFTLPEGMRRFRGDLFVAQAVYETTVGERNEWVVAAGYLGIDADTGKGDSAVLLHGNELRDYSTIVVDGQWNVAFGRDRLRLGATYSLNMENYDDASPGSFDAAHADEDTGYTVFATWRGDRTRAAAVEGTEDGGDGRRGYWEVGAYYTHMETFAFNSSYMQDDWLRWGSMTQTRGSNFEGTELRGVYGFSRRLDLVARLYVVEGIRLTNPGDAVREDGKRFRLDANFRF